jgi:hypothetical protein
MVSLPFFLCVLSRFLIYPSRSRSAAAHTIFNTEPRFRNADFIAEQPSDWKPFLSLLLESQLFSEFVDERTVLSSGLDKDVIFFDESIDAKLNRYTFRFHSAIDTPFLLQNTEKHLKTYVPPSPSVIGLGPGKQLSIYHKFPAPLR